MRYAQWHQLQFLAEASKLSLLQQMPGGGLVYSQLYRFTELCRGVLSSDLLALGIELKYLLATLLILHTSRS